MVDKPVPIIKEPLNIKELSEVVDEAFSNNDVIKLEQIASELRAIDNVSPFEVGTKEWEFFRLVLDTADEAKRRTIREKKEPIKKTQELFTAIEEKKINRAGLAGSVFGGTPDCNRDGEQTRQRQDIMKNHGNHINKRLKRCER